ncbi:MAG: amidohydrolase [Acidimicrobiia bacterium]|nr:amidohydrolase [Acidimicrobiia bacterium]
MTATDSAAHGDRPIDSWLAEHLEGLIAFRRQLHAHPELSGEEYATTESISERLSLAGVPTRRLTVGTGLIADVLPHRPRSGSSALAIRADIDALAMDDEKEVPYRSQVSGVAHACGHDVHTTIGLGTALYFAHHPDELPGPLRVLFQPAEERVPGGALDVLHDGGLDDVGAVLGLHCEPKMPVGAIGLRSGAISSAADMVCIHLHGPGGHTARPELTADLITIGAHIVADLPALVASRLADAAQVRIVFGSIQGGDAANVIPAKLELRAAVRSPIAEVWERLPRLVTDAVDSIVEGTGATHEVDYTHGVPAVVNDAEVTDTVRRAACDEFGEDVLYEALQSWGGDDFSWLSREVPGSYIRLGVHDPAMTQQLDLHAGRFDVDERAIGLGVRLLVATVREHFAE